MYSGLVEDDAVPFCFQQVLVTGPFDNLYTQPEQNVYLQGPDIIIITPTTKK